MKKTNKVLITLGSCILPLTCVLPSITSCNKKSSEISLDITGVDKNVVGYVANIVGTSQDLIIKGFKYTGPSDLSISATLENVTWSGTYTQPELINKTDNSFDLKFSLSNDEGIWKQTGSFDLQIKLNDVVIKVTEFKFEFVTSDVLCVAMRNGDITIPTKQTNTLVVANAFILTYKNGEIVTTYENFYVNATVKSGVQSKIAWSVDGHSILGRLIVNCNLTDIPTDGEEFDVEFEVRNKKLDQLGISWNAKFSNRIKISRNDSDFFDWTVIEDGSEKYARIQSIHTGDEKIIIPETLTKDNQTYPVKQVGYSSGSGNETCKEIVFPKNMTKFETIILCLYKNLEKVSINEVAEETENNGYYVKNNCLINHTTSPDEYRLVCGTTQTNIIPEEVTIIDGGALEYKKLKNIKIGRNVKQMGRNAFNSSQDIESFVVDPLNANFSSQIDGVEYNVLLTKKDSSSSTFDTITHAFNTTQDLPDDKGIKYVESYAYTNCDKKDSITLPSSIEDIEYSAFEGCSNLKEFTMPSKVTRVASTLFSDCFNLKTVNIHSNIKEIQSNAFRNCISLDTINWDQTNENTYKLCSYAFRNCISLANYTITKNTTQVKDNPFIGCSGLTSLKVEDGHTSFTSKFDGIESNCIVDNSNGRIIGACSVSTIPTNASVKQIGPCAFESTWFETITIPSNINWISSTAFDECPHLAQIIFPAEGTWKGYDRDEGSEGEDITENIKNPEKALFTLQWYGNYGHIAKDA